jgi:hypothetical protein
MKFESMDMTLLALNRRPVMENDGWIYFGACRSVPVKDWKMIACYLQRRGCANVMADNGMASGMARGSVTRRYNGGGRRRERGGTRRRRSAAVA